MNDEKLLDAIYSITGNERLFDETLDIQSVTKREVMKLAADEIQKTDPKEIISFGYSWLDDKLSGIFPGQLVLVGGESGTGKSTFTISILYKCPKKSAVFALEERLEDYGKKALYFEIGRIRRAEGKKQYPWNSFVRGELNGHPQFTEYIAKAYENLKQETPLFQRVEKMVNIDLIEKRIELLSVQGVRLILIDHLHYFDLLSKDSSKADYIEQIMVRLRALAIRCGVAIIIVAHYRKLNGNRPTLDSFKDSISIVQNASTVINIWRNREEGTSEAEKYKTQFIIPKSRDLGGEGKIDVSFNPNSGEYESPDQWKFGVPVVETNHDVNQLDL